MTSSSGSFDNVLTAHVGSFGRGQLKLLLVASLSHIAMAAVLMLMVFTSQDPIEAGAWECVPGSDHAMCTAILSSVTGGGGGPMSGAVAPAATPALPPPPLAATPLDTPAQRHAAFCALPAGTTRWTGAAMSMLSYYHLTCGREWLINVLNSVYFVGLALGGTGFGIVSDRFGRRTSMYICTALGAVATVGEALVPVFWLHALFRVVGAAAIQGMALADVVLVTELVGPEHRGRVGIATQSFFIVGECLLSLMAALVPDWRALTLLTAALMAAFLPTALIVPESPRWLAAAGRRRQAAAVLSRLARWNGRGHVSAEVLAAALAEADGAASAASASAASADAARKEGYDEGRQEEEAEADAGGRVKKDPQTAPLLGLDIAVQCRTGSSSLSSRTDVTTRTLAVSSNGASASAAASAAAMTTVTPSAAASSPTTSLPASKAVPSPPSAPPEATELPTAIVHIPPEKDTPIKASSEPGPRGSCPPSASSFTAKPTAAAAAAGGGGGAAAPTLLQAVRHPIVLRYSGIIAFAMCTLVLSYYGVGFALSYIPGSLYLSFFLVSVAEAPSSLVVGLLIDRVGRCALVLGGMAVSGVACIVCGLVEGVPVAQVLLAMLGKFGCSGAWSVLVVYCAEVFPTSVRSLLSGAIFQGARVGGVVAPFVFMMGTASGMEQLPFLLMGAVTLAAAALCVWLPETRGSPQPESLAQLEAHSERTVLAVLLRGGRRRRGRRQLTPLPLRKGDDSNLEVAGCGVEDLEGNSRPRRREEGPTRGVAIMAKSCTEEVSACRTTAVRARAGEGYGGCQAPVAGGGGGPAGDSAADRVPLLAGGGAGDGAGAEGVGSRLQTSSFVGP